MSLDISTMNLNKSQAEAVKWQDGPLLVLAGPGSGKTKVLTCRIARLIADSPGARFRVLGVTFTNKAATEMRNRIDALLAEGRDRVTLTTFHAFAAEVLRQHGSHVGLEPDFTILTEQADREAVLSDAIKAVPNDDEDFEPKAAQLLPLITRMLDECVLPDEAQKYLKTQPHSAAIAKIFKSYRTKLIAAKQIDFGSLLALAVELLEKRPAVAKQIQRIYSYVCVDECQDTNAAQFRLLVQLVPADNANLFVVADDDQVIYQWNGASPKRIAIIRDRYKMSLLQLPENYRCPAEVIELANNLIRHNSDRHADKEPLRANKKMKSDAVMVERFATFGQEREYIAKRLLAMKPEDRANTAILARRKKLLDDCLETLTEKKVPAYIAIRKTEFESAPYRWLHAALRLANAPQDREQLRRLSKAFYKLEGIDLDMDDVSARASVDQQGFLRAWLQTALAHDGVDADTSKLLEVMQGSLVDHLDYWPFVEAAHKWFESVKNRPTISSSAFAEFGDEKEIWNGLKADIGTHYTVADMSLHNYLQELDLHTKEKPAPKGAVRCLTIAASKGMEFKHVFLIGLVEQELPGYYATKKSDSSDEMREERRNCFVAITRAEETLTITFADSYHGYAKSPSRFLKEMAGDDA
jgi:DNA helicase-2/ATP-dependent DNA helicase PcrA